MRTVVVTGGAAGIGRAIATHFVADGARVFVADLDPARAPEGTTGVCCDVADTRAVEAMAAHVLDASGRIDVLVNNAGIASPPGLPFERNDEADWTRTLDVNVTSMFRVCKAFAPALRAQRGGAIVNIASTAGLIAAPIQPPYSVSKSAIVTFTRILAKDFARDGVRVNAVCPGFVWTDLWDELGRRIAAADERYRGLSPREVFDKRVRDLVPLARPQTAEDIATAVAFLASDAAANITGQALAVDGGLTS